MGIDKWESLVELLHNDGIGVVQLGKRTDRYVRGAYSLLGLTTPRQMISLLRLFDAVVTVDNLVMHAAHLWELPTLVLWGPTDHRVYGYAEQVHLQAKLDCEYGEGCVGPGHAAIYQTACLKGDAQCMRTFNLETVHGAIRNLLDKMAPQARPAISAIEPGPALPSAIS